MNKLRLNSRRQVFMKFGKTLRIELTTPELVAAPKKGRKNKPKFVEFKIQQTLARIEKFNTNPVIPFEIFY